MPPLPLQKFRLDCKALFPILAALLLLLAACQPEQNSHTLGLLSAANSDSLPAGAGVIAAEQKTGFEVAHQKQEANHLRLTSKPESALTDEIQVTVRSMVEDQNQPVSALVGASTNAGTTRIAALANFFNVPMIIPSAIGGNLLPSNNLWAFRLSAPGSQHAAYLFNEVLTRQTLANLTKNNEFAPRLRFGILYEQDTFGESTAVETAKAAMSQDAEIGFYGHFAPDAPETTRLLQAFSAMQQSDLHLLYVIASNPDSAQAIVRELNKFFVPGEAPLILGQSGGFASRQFLASPEAAGVFILRQKIVLERCPAEIETLAEAQAYAAIHLLQFALAQSDDQLSAKQNPSMLERREIARDSLKASNLNLPCLGPTSFDNRGENRNLQFEFLYAARGEPRLAGEEKLLELLALKMNRSPFE